MSDKERFFCSQCGPEQDEFLRPYAAYGYDTVDEKGEEIASGDPFDHNFDGDVLCAVCDTKAQWREPNNIELMKGAIEDASNE